MSKNVVNLFRRNYLAYFISYFAAQVVFIYTNVYLPVYFFNILNIDRTELAIVQFFSYLALFIKPIIAIYFDNKFSISKLKFMVFLVSIGFVFSFLIFLLSLRTLSLFGIFFGINLSCISVMDVAIDKIIVNSSPDDKRKDTNALFTQLGAIFGAILPNVVFYILFTDINSIPTWNLFYLIGIFSILPILCIGFLIQPIVDKPIKEEFLSEDFRDIKSIILMCIILFLFYGERIYEYPLEPWILNKYGEEYFSLFVLLLVIIIVINALGLIIGSLISNRLHRKKLLLLSSMIYGILLIIVPFTNIIGFFIIFAIMQIFSGIIVINLLSLMIKYSQKRVLSFQIMSTFAILALVIFIPLGTYLSVIISTESIIVIAGLFKLFALIPIYFLKIEESEAEFFEKNN